MPSCEDLLGFSSFYVSCFSSLLLIRDPVLLASDQHSVNLGLLFFFNESLLFPFLVYCSFPLFFFLRDYALPALITSCW
ncbi:hypothetical protein BDE02_09G057800 [Populus trichocarpa]|nr:hypothetical protein BDE02_09G057800 [Populus trichocarpa]